MAGDFCIVLSRGLEGILVAHVGDALCCGVLAGFGAAGRF